MNTGLTPAPGENPMPAVPAGGLLPSPALALLVALLVVDAVLVGAHLSYYATGSQDRRLLLNEERGYGELFQYAKYFGLAAVFLACAAHARRPHWLAWALLFAFLGLDDSMQIHETLARSGRGLVGLAGEGSHAPRYLGIRFQDWGEMLVAGAVGAALLGPIALAYWRGDATFRRLSRQLVAALLVLGVVGVGIDTVHEHALIKRSRWLHQAFGIADDGGELLIASAMAALVAHTLMASHVARPRQERPVPRQWPLLPSLRRFVPALLRRPAARAAALAGAAIRRLDFMS